MISLEDCSKSYASPPMRTLFMKILLAIALAFGMSVSVYAADEKPKATPEEAFKKDGQG